jgi:hypothetical protein
MKDDRTRKLQLNRETIRTLTTDEMARVAGGIAFRVGADCTCNCCPTDACQTSACPSKTCPTAPPLTSPGYCTNGCTVAIVRM